MTVQSVKQHLATITLRPYQEENVAANMDFFRKQKGNGISVVPTGGGKSIIISETVRQLGEPTLILQPSKEILVQNFKKYIATGRDASIYSASMNRKNISEATYATIGSIVKQPELFQQFRHVIIDECHFVNPKQGMYADFLKALGDIRVLGFTATPYRLTASRDFGAMLKFITRTRPRVFDRVVYSVDIQTLVQSGFLTPLTYYQIKGFDKGQVRSNSTGTDYDDQSLFKYMKQISFADKLIKVVTRLHEIRNALVVFTRFTEEAYHLKRNVEGVEVVTAQTPAKERDAIIAAWMRGDVKTLANVGILTTGVDYPRLDTVVKARPTKSLALWYQCLGRAIRIHPDKKDAWCVDMTDNYNSFGPIETLRLGTDPKGLYQVFSGQKPLTNVWL